MSKVSKSNDPPLRDEEKKLGMGAAITRRDFAAGMLLGSGAMLLDLPAALANQPTPTNTDHAWWTGYGGVGDYRNSHGNTWEALTQAHALRDGQVEDFPHADTDDALYDLVIVGGGASGLNTAYHFIKEAGGNAKVLILDNHPVFGGEAKQNEFEVAGHRLMGPQGANYFEAPVSPDAPLHGLFNDLGIPLSYDYPQTPAEVAHLDFDRTSYYYMWPMLGDHSPSISYYFHGESDFNATGHAGWVRDIWADELASSPMDESLKRDFANWHTTRKRPYEGDRLEQWLDSMSYEQYLTRELGLDARVARYCDEMLATGVGLGSDTCSAYFAYYAALPGFKGYEAAAGEFGDKLKRSNNLREAVVADHAHSFPGGNSGYTRHLAKYLIPASIEGGASHAEVMSGAIRFDRLDDPSAPVRMRLRSTAVDVRHGSGDREVHVTYLQDGRRHRVRSRTAVMASGGWVNKHAVRDLPESYRQACGRFNHSAVLVANVALTNWRFLANMGMTAARWFGGDFGFCCNIREPMWIGDMKAPFHPDKPIVLTFYAPLVTPGTSAREQGVVGRNTLLSTSYRDYELRIRRQMTTLFAEGGFNAERDIAGIILNRWGHAFVVPEPGFFYGRDGAPADRDVVRQRFGRIAFAHAELRGLQNFGGTFEEARRAVRQILEVL
jgi:spermidine dehydrogenase